MSESEDGSEEYEDLLPCEVYKRYVELIRRTLS